MSDWIKRILGGGKAPSPIDYDRSKEMTQSGTTADRLKVASNPSVRPEVLYFLATDPEAKVRRSVAANPSTPVHADLILTRDRDDAVRADLALKIARLAPTVNGRESDKLKQLTYEVLETLIQDQAVRVRQIMSETMKSMLDVPHGIVVRLARDPELAVAGPILQYSPVLTDDDLLDILRQLPVNGAAESIAKRTSLSSDVADVIGGGEDIDAITALLKNSSAQIREETLDRLVARAPQVLAWHRPLVDRPRLSENAVRKLARFVAADLIKRLHQRSDLQPETLEMLQREVLARIEADEPEEVAAANADKLLEEVRALHTKGKLGEPELNAALNESKVAFVRTALAVRTDMALPLIEKILAAQSPKGVTAMVWRAGLSMKFAVRVQTTLARIPPLQILKPTASEGFPISEEAMTWQMDFFKDI